MLHLRKIQISILGRILERGWWEREISVEDMLPLFGFIEMTIALLLTGALVDARDVLLFD